MGCLFFWQQCPISEITKQSRGYNAAKEINGREVVVSPLAAQVLVDEEVFTSSMENIEVVQELERRRSLVERGDSRLLTEEESWASIRSAGYDV